MNVLDRLIAMTARLPGGYCVVRMHPEWTWSPLAARPRWRSVVLKRISAASAVLSIQHMNKRIQRAVLRSIRLNTEEATWFRTVPR